MGFCVLRRGVPKALLALFEPFFFCPGDFPRRLAPSEEPVDGVALAAELVAVVVEGDTWKNTETHWLLKETCMSKVKIYRYLIILLQLILKNTTFTIPKLRSTSTKV